MNDYQCDGLIALAARAQIMREYELLGHIIRRLKEFELSHANAEAVEYFEAFLGSLNHESNAALRFESLASSGSRKIRSSALHALGSRSFTTGDLSSALKLYGESLQILPMDDVLRRLRIQKNIAACYAVDGDHKSALRLLESILPAATLVRDILPVQYLDFLNSFAFELGLAGRFDEAYRAARIVVSSVEPAKFPEWHETPQELGVIQNRLPSRMRIRIQPPQPAKVVTMQPLIDSRAIDREWRAILRLAVKPENRDPIRFKNMRKLVDGRITSATDNETVEKAIDSLTVKNREVAVKRQRRGRKRAK